MPNMTGSRFISETFKGYGITHLFVMPYVLNPVLRDAERLGINTVTVINNNSSLNQEQSGVEAVYGGRESGSDELWMLSDTDFVKVAESMDCFGVQVNKPGEFQSALEQALACDKPAVIDVKTHIEGIAPPAWLPKDAV